MITWLRRLSAVPKLLISYATLRADVEAVQTDPGVRAAFDRFRQDPAIAPIFSRISAEWRAVEEAVNQMR